MIQQIHQFGHIGITLGSHLFEVMTFIAVSIGQIFHAVPDAAGGLPLDDYASILA